MNGIWAKPSQESKSQGIGRTRQNKSVETAGSLAMNTFHSLFFNDTYDEFTSSNPFAVDYAMYADYGDVSYGTGFLSFFSNAMTTLGDGGFTGGDCGGGTSAGASSGASCGGGFTSFC